MKKSVILFIFIFSIQVSLSQQIQSPNKNFTLTFKLTDLGEPLYKLEFKSKDVIKTSRLGLELKDKFPFTKDFLIESIDTTTVDETWEPVWGEVKQIRNHYKEMIVKLVQPIVKNRRMWIKFRLFDDGLGFRYEFPEQRDMTYFTVSEEKTEFALTGDHKVFWIPGDYEANEYAYTTSKLSEVDATKGLAVNEIYARTVIGKNYVQTPLMMKTAEGLYINIHEAAQVNYPAMDLMVDYDKHILTSTLVPDTYGNKAYLQTPEKTPWRTIIVCEKAADILASKIILNLNEPSKIKDVSWIKPVKYIGIWWEMHVGTATWNYSNLSNIKLGSVDWKNVIPNGVHGANTARTKRYIDFAAQHGFYGVLVEGWDVGWEDWFGNWKEEVFDFVTPYPDFDVAEIQKYAASKGVKMIMHHETSASVTNYERRMDTAYRFMKEYGYDAVKTGYVGRIIPRGEFHDGQWMSNHYVRVAEKTAQYKIMLDAHEPTRPTGLCRTYPNWLACEAARGNEYNAWSRGNAPEHETILPFTRLMGGPMDYTPGIFQIKLDYWKPDNKCQVHTTLTKQLALYVTLYSPFQMAADYPEAYEKHLDAFQFIKDVAVDWDDTKILEAEPGDYLTIARKAKNKEEWYVGGITDENARESDIKLDFLTPKTKYIATIYKDAPDGNWEKNPMVYNINSQTVDSQTELKIKLVEGGGYAISIKPINK
jgi:glucan 1,4-alpha-glucosidase